MAGNDAQVREFLDYVVRSLVEHPEAVSLREVPGNRQVTFEISVDPADAGALNGTDGEILAALATVLDACAYKHHARADLVLLDGSGDAKEAVAEA